MKKFILAGILLVITILSGCTKKNEVNTLESGLQYFDDSLGTGREAKQDDLCSIHFSGWIVRDTSNLFSDWNADPARMQSLIGDSKQRNQPVKFILGTESFIKGSDEGIYGMKVGGKRTIIIPSELAYGEAGIGPIPPNSDLKVVVELLELKERVVAKMWDVPESLFKETQSGLKYAIVVEGEGQQADSGKVVTVNYTGFLTNGTKFDSSVERDEPFSFILGANQVIPGWDEGLKFMKKGGKMRLIIPPSLAYGSMDVGKIPANSTLVFDIEMLDIQ
jgi:peptidylprolyl isomerase